MESDSKVAEFREKIDEMVLSLANNVEMQPRDWSAARRILRFEQKLESAVSRMVRLGAIEEEEILSEKDLCVDVTVTKTDDLSVSGPSENRRI